MPSMSTLKAQTWHYCWHVLYLLLLAAPSHAGEITIAVASNFLAPAKNIAAAFETQTNDRVLISAASTGKLYAQISNGAPFEIFLAADSKHPALLIAQNLAIQHSSFIYAIGRLALWSPEKNKIIDSLNTLRQHDIRYIAIANPKTSPYGRAAYETLLDMNLWSSLKPKIVQGENINQAFQFTASGNADLGFVALSQILNPHNQKPGSRWEVPQKLHTPLDQMAVLLQAGAANVTAKLFLQFLQGPVARVIIKSFGYDLKI